MKNWGIKGRVLFLALVPALLIAAGLTVHDINTRLSDIEQSLHERGFAIVRQLGPACEFGVFSGNSDILNRMAQTTLQEADVISVTITDRDGRILGQAGQLLANPPLRAGTKFQQVDITEHPYSLVFSAPIRQSQTEVENYISPGERTTTQSNEAQKLGHVVVELSRIPSLAKKNKLILSSTLITLFGLTISALIALRMARQVTEPIMTLADAVAKIGRGHLNTYIETTSHGELGVLENGVNNMATALRAVQDAQEERRAILATVLDSLDALVYVADMKTYELLFINKYAQNTFGNVTGKSCWQALQSNQSGPCSFCTNNRLLKHDLTPGEPVIWEFQNTINQRWYLIQDSAIRWVDGRTVRLEIATDITESKLNERRMRQLEKQIMEISEHEREHIGHELHDGVGQLLTGIAFLSKALSQKLSAQSLKEAAASAQIVTLINQTIAETRQLARGLQPVEIVEHGLMSALDELASNIEKTYAIDCKLATHSSVALQDNTQANHLYRIAQEAVNNAIKHGHARHISIELSKHEGKILLVIRDDGSGFQPGHVESDSGMGLQIMRYRANVIGASLGIESTPGTGSQIRVSL